MNTVRKHWPGYAVLLIALVLVGASGLGLVATAQTDLGGLDPRLVAKSDGPSGLKWIGGNRESSLMNPGMNCISCHAQGEGPRVASAGTVYSRYHEKDLEFGVEGVTVQVTDAAGRVISMVTNKAGNFMSKRGETFTMPISVKLLYKGAERRMLIKQQTTNCMICHTSAGVGGAPGRIVAP